MGVKGIGIRNAPQRLSGHPAVAFLAVLVVGLLLVPSAAGAPATASVVLVTPPYKHALAVQNVTASHTGPCNLSGAGTTSANATTGILLSSSDVKEHCANSVATIVTVVGLLGPGFSVSSTGTYNVSYALMVGWHYAIQANGVGSAQANLSIVGNLFDNSTGTWVVAGAALLGNETTVLRVGCTSTSSLACANHSIANGGRVVDQNLSATLTAGDRYLFYVVVVVTVSAQGGRSVGGTFQPGSSFASFSTNFTGAKHGIRVLSMTVS